MMFEVDTVINWDNMSKHKGDHETLKNLFVDKDAPYWAMVGNKDWVVTRNVDSISKKVTFQIYKRNDFIKATYWHLYKSNQIN